MSTRPQPTRLVPERALPPYTFVPGLAPHPRSDPAGHSFATPPPVPPAGGLDPERWTECREYLYGMDLFNHGFYWEAHEVWESLWHACGRVGVTASFLKGLIKLAAAGVKVREGKPAGVRSHARRARALFEQVAEHGTGCSLALSVAELIHYAREVERRAEEWTSDQAPGVQAVFPWALRPAPSAGPNSGP